MQRPSWKYYLFPSAWGKPYLYIAVPFSSIFNLGKTLLACCCFIHHPIHNKKAKEDLRNLSNMIHSPKIKVQMTKWKAKNAYWIAPKVCFYSFHESSLGTIKPPHILLSKKYIRIFEPQKERMSIWVRNRIFATFGIMTKTKIEFSLIHRSLHRGVGPEKKESHLEPSGGARNS